jgi:hypothetical protein
VRSQTKGPPALTNLLLLSRAQPEREQGLAMAPRRRGCCAAPTDSLAGRCDCRRRRRFLFRRRAGGASDGARLFGARDHETGAGRESFLSAGASTPDAVKHSQNIALARQSRVAAALTLNGVFCPSCLQGGADIAIRAPGGTSARVNSRAKFSRPFSDERLLVRRALPRLPCAFGPRWGTALHRNC